MTTNERAPLFEAVEYPFPRSWRQGNWYTRVTYADGRTLHSEPWMSHWAADHLAGLWRNAWYRALSKRGDIGNGDTCPLFPDHGNMQVMWTSPPRQYCPHQIHDGGGKDAVPASRAFWPLFGFEESVTAYFARLDRAIREATPEDLGGAI